MAGPIKISILADASSATSSVKTFADTVDNKVGGVGRTFEDTGRKTKRSAEDMGKGFDKAAEGADGAESKAQGFADTLTGTKDVMSGVSQIASGDLGGGLVTLGTGFADLAGGASSFLIPAVQKASTAFAAMNATLLANPIILIVALIVALVAAIVIAYKKNEKFREVVDKVWAFIKKAFKTAVDFIKEKLPPVWDKVKEVFDKIKDKIGKVFTWVKKKFTDLPGKVKAGFKDANQLLYDKGKDIVEGLWEGVKAMGSWISTKVSNFITDNITGPIQNVLKIFSPSRVMRDLGKFIPMGLAMGIDDASDKVRSATANMTAATVPSISSVGSASATNGSPQLVRLELPNSSSGAGALILALLKEEVRKGGGLKAVFG